MSGIGRWWKIPVCTGASSLVSQVPSWCRGGCLGISRDISDTVFSSQMLFWDDFYHSVGTHSYFSPFALFGTHPVPVPWRELFLVAIGQNDLSSPPWIHLSTLAPGSFFSAAFYQEISLSNHAATMQGARLLKSGPEVPFSALVLLARSAGREGETLSRGSIIITFPVMKSMPWKSIFSIRQNKSIAICKESHCD